MSWFSRFEHRVENFFHPDRMQNLRSRMEHHPEPAPVSQQVASPTTKLVSDSSTVSGSQRLSALAVDHEPPPLGWTASIASTAVATAAPPPSGPTVGGLESQIKQILGPGVSFSSTGGSQWSVKDLQGLLSAIQAVPPSVRSNLGNTTFTREPSAPDGSGDVAQTNFGGNEQVGGPLTISFTNAASTSGQFEDIAVHEFGNVAIGGGRFDPDAVREFGKLSHFTNADGTIADGHDSSGLESVTGTKPLNTTNFVQDAATSLAQGSPEEDYAESFRSYVLHPDDLMKAAPDKFLYLNAQFGKYTPSQVQTMAANDGVDLPMTMAELRNSDLRPDTLNKIGQTQGLSNSGAAGSAAGNVVSTVMANLGNASFVSQFTSGNAQQALGPTLWGQLSQSEQSLLSQPAYASKLLATVKANQAAPADDVTDSDVTAMKNFVNLLMQQPSGWDKAKMFLSSGERSQYIENLIHNPSVWNNLDPSIKNLLNSSKGQDVINTLANNQGITNMMGKIWGGIDIKIFGFTVGHIGPYQDPQTISNMQSNASRIGPAEVEAMNNLIKSDNPQHLDTLANALSNLGQGVDTANAGSANLQM